MTSNPSSRSLNLIVHPLCFGLFPLFSILSANMAWAGLGEVLLPAGVVLAITIALWLVLWPLLPQPHKRALVVSLFWLPFFSFGTIVEGVRRFAGTREMIGPVVLLECLALALTAAGVTIFCVGRSPRSFRRVTTVLNRFSAGALSVSVAVCGLVLVQRNTYEPAIDVQNVGYSNPSVPAERLPNIYYIISDAYPRSDYLKSFIGYDDTPFLDQLRDRGFYVADRSRSNYCNTLPSLASTLNLDYLDPALVPRYFRDLPAPLFSAAQDNRVVQTLKKEGYEFVTIASGLFATEMKGADRLIRPGESPFTEYQQYLIDLTPIRVFLNRLKKERWHHRVPFVLDTLAALEPEGRPMFVFAHLFAPHMPHSYDKDGRILEESEFPPLREGWHNVTTFLNTRLVEVVDAILEREPNSVIIIQGDHGCNVSLQSASDYAEAPWRGTWENYVRDRSANLSTYYFPDRQYEGLLYPEITPVNSFRVIFNKYLGTTFPLLEDVTYLTPQNSRELVRVEEVY